RSSSVVRILVMEIEWTGNSYQPFIVDDGVGVQADAAIADGQRTLDDQLRPRALEADIEIVHEERMRDRIRLRIDRGWERRREMLQLIGDDDDVVGCDRNGPGFPIIRIAPQPARSAA